jgi:hypothetical protein
MADLTDLTAAHIAKGSIYLALQNVLSTLIANARGEPPIRITLNQGLRQGKIWPFKTFEVIA